MGPYLHTYLSTYQLNINILHEIHFKVPRGIFTLVHVSSYKIIQTFESNVPDYFKIIIIIIIVVVVIIIIIIGTSGSTSFAFNCDQNSRILFTCDNTYTVESKDDFIFVELFFHLIPFVVCD